MSDAPAKTNGATPLIEVRDISKSFGSQRVLSGVTLEVHPGETLVVLGRSGSGKSVILKHIIGLLRPDEGCVMVEGNNVSVLSERQLGPVRKMVTMLFQSAALFDSMTVERNLAFPLREAGLHDMALIREKVAAALEMVDLAGTEKKMPDSLSGGMRKRVGLARAIVGEPKCILYDEPTTGLDPVVSDSINRLIRRLQRRLRVTSIVVTHDMKSAFHVADRITYLHEGRIYFTGTAEEFRATRDPLLRDFIEGRSDEVD